MYANDANMHSTHTQHIVRNQRKNKNSHAK